jgi:RNA polymerase sigma factor (sigma-70 family)
VSPLTVRRYRAERLLRDEFETLRDRVIGVVVGRLCGGGVELDRGDLEACYAAAWQGLYMAILEGQEIVNPTGWLVLVTYRRAIEESRSTSRLQGHDGELAQECEPDFARELDDRMRLRQLFEALRGRLSGREREAAVLCYLQGLPRAQAAAQMGISEARLRKLMEGRGPGRPGVAGKVGALVETIREGGWCEEQSSLMRALAFGVLDPDGERHQLALLHQGECPACRAYVLSLRGLAAALPPLLLPGGLGVGALAHAGKGLQGSGASVGGGGGAGAGGAAPLAGLGASASAGGAGGGWMLVGGGKIALGCALALSVGASCVTLGVDGGGAGLHARGAHRHSVASLRGRAARTASLGASEGTLLRTAVVTAQGATRARASHAFVSPARKASREFGLEQSPAAGSGSSSPPSHSRQAHLARAATAGAQTTVSESSSTRSGVTAASGSSAAAEREFSPG